MKTLTAPELIAACLLAAMFILTGRAAETPEQEKEAPEARPTKIQADTPAAPAATEEKPTAPSVSKGNSDATTETNDKLRLNFRGVPLEMVLDYLSEAAGFIIIKETDVKGKVDVWSNQPLTKDEAVDLLNTILNKNEYAAIRNGRTLTIVSREEAKKRTIPVKKGGEAEEIPKTDEMVTQIIPVKHANVTQLMNNLRPLIGTYAEMTINESANSLILTATQADIKRMTEIINALDESISGTSTIRVFQLKYADAKELANAIREVFPANPQGTGNRGQGGGFQGGFGGFPGGGFPGGRGGALPIEEALRLRGTPAGGGGAGRGDQ